MSSIGIDNTICVTPRCCVDILRKTIGKGMVIRCRSRNIEKPLGVADSDSPIAPDKTGDIRSDGIKYCQHRASQSREYVKVSADLK